MGSKILGFASAALSVVVVLILVAYSAEELGVLLPRLGYGALPISILSVANACLLVVVLVYGLRVKLPESNVLSLYLQSLRASVLNTILPFLGTGAKVAYLKTNNSLDVVVSLKLLVFAGLHRILGALVASIFGWLWMASESLYLAIGSVAVLLLLARLSSKSLLAFLFGFRIPYRGQVLSLQAFVTLTLVEFTFFVCQAIVLWTVLSLIGMEADFRVLLIGVGVAGLFSVIPTGFFGIGAREGILLIYLQIQNLPGPVVATALLAEKGFFYMGLTIAYILVSAIARVGKPSGS